jgi:hypothetical protein
MNVYKIFYASANLSHKPVIRSKLCRERGIVADDFVLSSAPHKDSVELPTLGLEQRLANLEAQIDRVSMALQRWREDHDQLPPTERQIAQLTEQCADLLKQWSTTADRHSQAVGDLEAKLTGWNDVETRLQRDAQSRYQALEHAIENEWASLRRLHEEPARQLRTYAESLTEISVATAGSAQSGLERAEARLATLERDIHKRMDDLSRDVQNAVAELRHRDYGPALRSQASPWALDEVTRLHDELRQFGDAPKITAGEPARLAITGATVGPQTAPTVFEASHEPAPEEPTAAPAAPEASAPAEDADTRPISESRRWAPAALAVGFGVAVVFAAFLYRQANAAVARASEAQQQLQAIASAAEQQIEAAGRNAAARIELAQAAASKAQTTSDILVAPDLIRFNLAGGDAAGRSSGQLLWSRSRGMVFSGSRLPPPPSGNTYQIWLLTAGPAVSGGTFVPDESGRAVSATGTPPVVPRAVIGVMVTLEQQPGAESPSDRIVLSRAS